MNKNKKLFKNYILKVFVSSTSICLLLLLVFLRPYVFNGVVFIRINYYNEFLIEIICLSLLLLISFYSIYYFIKNIEYLPLSISLLNTLLILFIFSIFFYSSGKYKITKFMVPSYFFFLLYFLIFLDISISILIFKGVKL